MLVWCWATVSDAVSALSRHWVCISCKLCNLSHHYQSDKEERWRQTKTRIDPCAISRSRYLYTRCAGPMLGQCRASVSNAGPALEQHWPNSHLRLSSPASVGSSDPMMCAARCRLGDLSESNFISDLFLDSHTSLATLWKWYDLSHFLCIEIIRGGWRVFWKGGRCRFFKFSNLRCILLHLIIQWKMTRKTYAK